MPTWNYITVHAWGRPRVMDDAAWLRRQIDDLTRTTSDPRAVVESFRRAGAFVAAQIKGIVGLEIPIARIEGKWKVSQNRPAIDQAGVVAGLPGQGDDADAMAELVAERGKQVT